MTRIVLTILFAIALSSGMTLGQQLDHEAVISRLALVGKKAGSASASSSNLSAFHLPQRLAPKLYQLRGEERIFVMPLDVGSAVAMKVDALWPGASSGLGLTGKGISIGLWEQGGFPELGHPEFADDEGSSRIFLAGVNSAFAGITAHATKSAGFIAARGNSPDLKGVSFEAFVIALDDSLDLDEMAQLASEGMQVSNHSYGYAAGWQNARKIDGENEHPLWFGNTTVSGVEDYKFGFYDERSHELDNIAFDNPHYNIVFAAGNSRKIKSIADTHWVMTDLGGPDVFSGWTLSSEPRPQDRDNDGGFDTILGGSQTAKNVISVGAIINTDVGVVCDWWSVGENSSWKVFEEPLEVAAFSSWGPTDDGRIKPDFVGVGHNIPAVQFSSRPSPFTCYNRGTSVAAPQVTSVLALLIELDERYRSGRKRPAASYRALLAHTGQDLGESGPDYRYGWGLPNAEAASQLVVADYESGEGVMIRESRLGQGTGQSMEFVSDGSEEFRVTIAWTDPAAVPTFRGQSPSPAWLDSPTPRLVNDLDIRVIDENGVVYYPWTMDPANPSAAAKASRDNKVDNIEQIVIRDPDPGLFTVTVGHKHYSTLSGGGQDYSLIVTGYDQSSSVVELGNELPIQNALQVSALAPNPASSSSSLSLVAGKSEVVGVTIFNALGQTVRSIFDGMIPAGTRRKLFVDTSLLPSGTYYVRVRSNSGATTRSLTIRR